ncbi:MAG: hypothetical protein GY792_30280 [Gammaproteobacteria bacterium]|nr:hypothetical protein [Gammaproteobacteria bacterium]
MNPEQAWQEVLDQLQLEMPKASFDAWVQNTQVLACENGIFTIGCQNDYAQQWLEKRLTSTIARLLVGMLNRSVDVKFIVSPDQDPAALLSAQHPSEDNLDENVPETLELTAFRTSLRNIMIHPERVVVIPAGILRWLPYLGAERGWFWVAMRQRYYECHHTNQIASGKAFRASAKHVTRWMKGGRSTFWKFVRELECDDQGTPGSMLAWLIEKSYTGNRTQANSYRFHVDLPLTPGDVEHLEQWLMEQDFHHDPVGVLQKAVKMQPREILPYPAPYPKDEHYQMPPHPRTTAQVILDFARELSLDKSQRVQVARLAEQLQTRLQNPADNLHLTHYFIQEWLPILGAGPAWMIALLRDRGYINHRTGEIREHIALSNGYEDIVNILGLKGPETVGLWLPPLEAMAHQRTQVHGKRWAQLQQRRAHVEKFILEKAGIIYRGADKMTDYSLKIRLDEPLTPTHTHIYTAFLAVIADGQREPAVFQQVADIIETEIVARNGPTSAREVDDPRRALQTTSAQIVARSGQPLDASTRVMDYPSEHRPTKWTTLDARNARFKIPFKHLSPKILHEIKHLFLSLVHEDDFQATDNDTLDEQKGEGGVGDHLPTAWELTHLQYFFEIGGLARENRNKLHKQFERDEFLSRRFRAWMLYGYAHSGINNPVRFAIKRMMQRAPPAYWKLAGTSPAQLSRWLTSAYAPRPASLGKLLNLLVENDFTELLADMAAPYS